MDDNDRERLLMDLLSEAVELEGEERQAVLDRARDTDHTLHEELLALLEGEEALDDGFMEMPAASRVTHLTVNGDVRNATPVPIPERIGDYRVVRVLGRGGMGIVYQASQERPIRRQVAIKVIEGIGRSSHKRFAAECQALARLAHPNIASMYEVGATDDGKPYVVIELVEGSNIATWCDDQRLGIPQRIELFLGVCAGIRHAHEKGILHRDLKATNVLVTEVDGRPVAKVIDFGIARGLDDSLLSSTAQVTLENQILGSPAYMSPEAARGQSDLDTRSDVYALGLLLYELLVGVLPIDGGRRDLASILRRVAREERTPPSKMFAEVDEDERLAIAYERGLTEKRLLHQVRGDLDAIVGKAIELDREKRYSSPADLAADLKRHLAHRPVEARPATLAYVGARYLRRQAGLVIPVTLLILALIAGIVARTREAENVRREAQRTKQALQEAEEISSFLVELFEIADPERGPDDALDARQLLERGVERVRNDLSDPRARARFLLTIAGIYTNMAQFEKAEALVAETLAIRRNILPRDHPEVLASLNQLGVIYRRQGRLQEAEPLFREVLDARLNADERDPVAIAMAHNNLGNVLWNQERLDEAEAQHRQALTLRQQHLDDGHPDLAGTLVNLGALLSSMGRFDEARTNLERADALLIASQNSNHPRRGVCQMNLADIAQKLGQISDAATHFREANEIFLASYGPAHPRTLRALRLQALELRRAGRDREAVSILERPAADLEASPDADLIQVARTMLALGVARATSGETQAAEGDLQDALAKFRRAGGEDHPLTLVARGRLAWLDARRGRFAEAEAEYRRVLAKHEALNPESGPTGWTLHHLALAVAGQRRDDEAEALLERALAVRRKARGEPHREIGETLFELAVLARHRDEKERSLRLLREALDVHWRDYDPADRNVARAREFLADLTGP